jgi:xylulokinase
MSFGGLDIGTSGCKCTLFNNDGKQLAVAYRPYQAKRSMGLHEIDVLVIWQAAKEVIAEAARVAGDPPEAISVSSFGETCALLDINDQPVIPAMLYTDPRGDEEAAQLAKNPGDFYIYGISGHPPDFTYTMPKLMWANKHLAANMRQVTTILPMASFIIYRLTGEKVSDPSLASRTMMLDVKKLQWSPELLSLAGISVKMMPEVVEIGTIAGSVKKVLADELGIPETMKIIVGAHDQVVSAIGAGVLDAGAAVNSSGTVECITPVFEKVAGPDTFFEGKFPTVPMLKDKYVTYTTIFSGGLLLQWFRENFIKGTGDNSINKLDSAGMENPTGILVQPHFAGAGSPYYDPDSRGAMVGLTLEYTAADIYKALQEGICYESKLNLELLAGAGIKIQSLRIVGGGEKSNRWNQMKADIYGIPCTTLKAGEAGATGSAMLAGTALGKYANLEQAVSTLVEEKETYLPRREFTDAYDSLFSRYKKVYKAVKNI